MTTSNIKERTINCSGYPVKTTESPQRVGSGFDKNHYKDYILKLNRSQIENYRLFDEYYSCGEYSETMVGLNILIKD